ncbi:MAG: cation:proton antiporter domain-containing protein [Gaiellaceae bacterium]
MTEFSSFGLSVLTVAGIAAALLVSTQIASRLPLPGAAFFLIAAAAASNLFPAPRSTVSILGVERIAVVALILILFDGGIKVGWQRFRTALAPIALLGTFGTAGTAALTALFAHYLLGFGWLLAGILGGALAPTDPAVMFSVLRGRQLGGRSSAVLEGESGINDPVSIALVVGLLRFADTAHGSLFIVVREWLIETGVGTAVGVAVGSIVPFWLRHARFSSEGLYGIAGVVAAAVAYGAASFANGSGFLAVFIVGVLLGAERTPHKGQIDRFSEALASFAEMAAFAALGLTIDLGTLGHRQIWLDGLILAVLVVFVARPLVVLPLLARFRLRRGERLFIAWAGMKGAVPILLAAFAVIAGFESERMYGIVTIVVLFSVVVHGSTVRPVAERLAIPLRAAEREPGARRAELPETTTIDRYRVSEGSRAAGSAVRRLPLGSHRWVDAIVRNGQDLKPRGRDVIRPGDEIHVSSDRGARTKGLRRLLEEPRPHRDASTVRARRADRG